MCDQALAQRIFGLFDTYESHVLGALQSPAGAEQQGLGLTVMPSKASDDPSIVSVMSPQWVDGASFEAELEVSN